MLFRSKAVPWNYGVEVYYHGIKQDYWINENKNYVTNIVGASKVTRTGRIFSPDISPPITTTTLVRITNDKSSANTRGKEKEGEPAGIEEPTKDTNAEEPSSREMEEILKIIKKSDFKIVEQLAQNPSKISMLTLLLCPDTHAQALIKFLNKAHVPPRNYN